MSSHLDTPTRKAIANGGASITSPLNGGLGLSSLGRNYARSNLYRGSQPLPTNPETPETGNDLRHTSSGDSAANTSNWSHLVTEMNRQLSECAAELARSREVNSQLQQQLQQVLKRLDEVTAELHTSRTVNQQLAKNASQDYTQKAANPASDSLNQSIKDLTGLISGMRMDIQRINSQLTTGGDKPSTNAQIMEQQTMMLLRGLQQQTQQQQEASAMAMATMNAAVALMINQGRPPPPPQPIPQPPQPISAFTQSQLQSFSSPVQAPKSNPIMFQQAAPPQATVSGPKKQMMTGDSPMAQMTHNIFSPNKITAVASPIKPPVAPPPVAAVSASLVVPKTAPIPGVMTFGSAPPAKAHDPIFDKFKPKEGAWRCDACYVDNDVNAVTCVACQTPKPGATKTAPTMATASSNILGNAKISTPQFSFGSAIKTSAPPPMFSFGATKPAAAAASTTADFSFKFGSSSSTPAAPVAKVEKPVPVVAKEDSDNETVEQCDEDKLYFKPVLEKLPDKIEVVTGEEKQSVLFEDTARLFRLREGQWVERGNGVVKILQDMDTKKARLVMRQEQTLKVCCNHPLLAEMSLTMLTKGKSGAGGIEQSRSWTWWAVDFAEPVGDADCSIDGGHREFFAIRFSKVEPSQKFHKVFTECCKSGSSPLKKDGAVPQPETGDDVQIIDVLSVSKEQQEKAEALKLPKEFYAFENGIKNGESDHMTEEETKEEDRKLQEAINKSLQQNKKPTPVKPVEEPKPTVGLFSSPTTIGGSLFGTPTTTSSTGGLFGSFGSTKEDSKNPPATGLFGSNNKENTLFGSSISSGGGLFGTPNAAVTASANSPALFNLSNATKDTPSPGASLFSAAANKGMLDFNQLNKSTDGSSASKPVWLTQGGGGVESKPKWATDTPLFASSSDQKKSESLNEPQEDAEGHMVEDPNYDPQYQPIVSLPEVEVKTGEENEVCMFLTRVKAYRLIEGEWKERGIGELKILVTPEKKLESEINPREEWDAARDGELGKISASRLLMRREQVLKICLNQTISQKLPFNFKPVGGSKRVVCWKGVDYSSGEAETETFSLRFKDEDEYARFTACLERTIKLPRA